MTSSTYILIRIIVYKGGVASGDWGNCLISCVARVYSLRPGQEIFLRPPSTKTTEFEVKNKCKSAEEAKTEHLLLLFCS